jgi:TrmH family RNA methyltransferase
MFLVEGKRSVEEAFKRSELLKVIFLDDNSAEEDHGDIDLSFLDYYLVNSRLMKHICCTENPQGVAAIVKKPLWSWEELLGTGGLLIYLDQVADPGNMGSILRSCWALGVAGVLLAKGSIDPFSPKVVRSSMGAIMNLPVFQNVSDSQLDMLSDRGYKFLCTDINGGTNYYSVKYKRQSLIVIGSEARGVSADLKKRCEQFINIPSNPQVDSLNVAAACAIIIAETWRQYQEETGLA